MAPFQAFYLILSLVVFAAAWLRGGHTERAGVVTLVVGYIASFAVHDLLLFDDFRLAEFLIDLAVAVAFIWLAIRRDRWWTLAASAFCVLVIAAHMVMLFVPELDSRGDVAARWGLGVLVIFCLAAGVLERWMAGEPSVASQVVWGRRSRTS